MEIIRNYTPEMTIEDFANRHGLIMEVTERRGVLGPMRFYARFQNSDTLEPGVVVGTFGNGPTEQLAIREYADAISQKRLVLNAFRDSRVEIDVPRLV